MGRNVRTSAIVDEIIRLAAEGFYFTSAIVAPGSAIGLAKPFDVLIRKLDSRKNDRDKKRELQRVVYYMKEQGYLAGEYEHGLQLTERARKRYENNKRQIKPVKAQNVWDGWWRIIIYDIPEEKKYARESLNRQLRSFGCFELQQSVLITPFPCAQEIATIAGALKVDKYVTFFEAQNLANPKPLIHRFEKKYPATKFQ